MRIVCVGRDYGFQEAAAGRPFVGPSGKLLTKAMTLAGFDRAAPDVLITNVVNKRPPHDEWGAHAASDVADGLDKLQQTLTLAQPELIVALGEHALQAITCGDPNAKPPKKQTITETRGYVFDSAYGRVLAMVHPAFILRTWHPWWATFCYDWQKAARVLRDGVGRGGREQTVSHALAPPNAALPIAVDIETTGTGAGVKPVCIAFAWDVTIGYVYAWEPANVAAIRALLESRNPKVFQNGQFDVTILERMECPVVNWTDDVMLLHHTLDPLIAGKQGEGTRTEKSLRFLASLYTDEPFFKDYRFESGSEEQRVLCARDSRITLAVHAALTQRLQGGAPCPASSTSSQSCTTRSPPRKMTPSPSPV